LLQINFFFKLINLVVKKFMVFIYIMKLIKDHTSVLWNQGQSNNYNKWSQNHIYIYIYIYIIIYANIFSLYKNQNKSRPYQNAIKFCKYISCYHESLYKNYIQNLQNSFQDQDINGMFG
jgi:hypothetical protein